MPIDGREPELEALLRFPLKSHHWRFPSLLSNLYRLLDARTHEKSKQKNNKCVLERFIPRNYYRT